MKPCVNRVEFNWIAKGREEPNPRGREDPLWTGNKIRHLLPEKFEAYVKILHGLAGRYDSIDAPLSQQELTVLNIPACDQLRELVEGTQAKDGSTRLKWRDVADRLALPFSSEITDDWFRARLEPGCWPRYIYGPDNGYLEHEDYSALLELLTDRTPSERCFFRLAEVPFVLTEQPLLYEGTMGEVTSIPTTSSWNFPEYWWPFSRKWCLCSDYDLPFTVIGGTRELIHEILESDMLETIEVFPDTRIDCYAPIP